MYDSRLQQTGLSQASFNPQFPFQVGLLATWAPCARFSLHWPFDISLLPFPPSLTMLAAGELEAALSPRQGTWEARIGSPPPLVETSLVLLADEEDDMINAAVASAACGYQRCGHELAQGMAFLHLSRATLKWTSGVFGQ